MNKKTVGIVILLITIIVIVTAVILTPKEERTADTENSQKNAASEEAYLEFKKYIISSKELIQDTDYYIQVRDDITGTFDTLNQQTDELLDIIFDNKPADISDKLNAIKKGDTELSAKIDAAADKFVTNDFKSSFASLKKYVNLQNQMIYKIADIYEKEKNVSYELFTGMLHTTHQDMSNQEIDYINFLSGVDYYADKEK